MSNNEAVYNEAMHEKETSTVMDRINQQSAAQEAAQEVKSRKQAEEREKTHRRNFFRHIGRSVATVTVTWLLVLAMNAELISPVLVIPATYITTFGLGWWLCESSRCGRKVWEKR